MEQKQMAGPDNGIVTHYLRSWTNAGIISSWQYQRILETSPELVGMTAINTMPMSQPTEQASKGEAAETVSPNNVPLGMPPIAKPPIGMRNYGPSANPYRGYTPAPKQSREPKPVGYYSRIVLILLGSLLMGAALIYFVAANWERLGDAGKLGLMGIFYLVAMGIGFLALRRNKAIWQESAAIFIFAAIVANYGFISQVQDIQLDATWLTKQLVWMGVLLAIGLESRIIYVVTSFMIIGCSLLNEYNWWYICIIWVAYDIAKILLTPRTKLAIPTLIAQLSLWIYAIWNIGDIFGGGLALALLSIIMFIYDRLYMWYSRGYQFSIFKAAGITVFICAIGPGYFSLGFGEIYTCLIAWGICVIYLSICYIQSQGYNNPSGGFQVSETYLPISAVFPVATCLGISIGYFSVLAGMLISALIIGVVYSYFGGRRANANYTRFGLAMSVYLVLIILFASTGDFGYRSVLSAISGAVLLGLNWFSSRRERVSVQQSKLNLQDLDGLDDTKSSENNVPPNERGDNQ